MELKYKIYKVFDCYDMPEKVKTAFFAKYRGHSNYSYIKYYCYDEQYPEDDTQFGEGEVIRRDESCGYVTRKGYDLISDWLCENGAVIGEEVLIKHSW